MASNYAARITKVVTNGPFSYIISKDGAGLIDVNNITSFNSALNAVRDAIAADMTASGLTTVISTSIATQAT